MAERSKRWADESDEASESEEKGGETEEVKGVVQSQSGSSTVYLSNLPYIFSESDVLAGLTFSEDERTRLSLKLNFRDGRFSGEVELTSSDPAIIAKVRSFKQKEIGGRPLHIYDAPRQSGGQPYKQSGRGGKQYERRGHGGPRYNESRGGDPEGPREHQGGKPHYPKGQRSSEQQGGKPHYSEVGPRKPRENYKRDPADPQRQRDPEIRKPIRNENPEYRAKVVEEAPQRPEVKV
jgi:hypothetical protein